jgi:vitamin B12 transporter
VPASQSENPRGLPSAEGVPGEFSRTPRGGCGIPGEQRGPKYALDRALETRDTTSGLGAIEWKHATERWSHVADVDVFNQDQDQNSPAIFDQLPPSSQTIPATNSDTIFRRTRVNASTSGRLVHGWTATVGAAYRRETGENLGSIAGFGPVAYRLTRNAKALFAESVLDRRKWSVVAGIRSDWVSGGFERLSPRVGASVAFPWSGARLRSSWGNGFKMPSFYALAQPFVGNPRLPPETSTAFDIGIEQKLGQRFGVIAGNLFWSAYRDLVDFSPELFRLVNRSEALARGGDVSWRKCCLCEVQGAVRWKLPSWIMGHRVWRGRPKPVHADSAA